MADCADLRELIKAEIALAGRTHGEVSKAVGVSQATMCNMLSGISSVSYRAFSGLVKTLDVAKRPVVLQTWLAAYVAMRIDKGLLELIELAGWTYGESEERTEQEQRTIHRTHQRVKLLAELSPANETAERRLQLLQALCGESEGLDMPAVTARVKMGKDLARKGLIALKGQGFVTGWTGVKAGAHPFMKGQKHRRKVSTWAITPVGENFLRRYDLLDDDL
jgi:hypothetical protein